MEKMKKKEGAEEEKNNNKKNCCSMENYRPKIFISSATVLPTYENENKMDSDASDYRFARAFQTNPVPFTPEIP